MKKDLHNSSASLRREVPPGDSRNNISNDVRKIDYRSSHNRSIAVNGGNGEIGGTSDRRHYAMHNKHNVKPTGGRYPSPARHDQHNHHDRHDDHRRHPHNRPNRRRQHAADHSYTENGAAEDINRLHGISGNGTAEEGKRVISRSSLLYQLAGCEDNYKTCVAALNANRNIPIEIKQVFVKLQKTKTLVIDVELYDEIMMHVAGWMDRWSNHRRQNKVPRK